MNDSVSSAIATLKSSTNKLNSLTDKAAETIKSVEKFLSKDCSIGFSAYVPIKELSNTKLDRYLEYRRIGVSFRIAVVTNTVKTDQEVSEKAWSDCSRSIKIKSIPELPKLILEITKQVNKSISEAEGATKIANNVLNSLKGKGA